MINYSRRHDWPWKELRCPWKSYTHCYLTFQRDSLVFFCCFRNFFFCYFSVLVEEKGSLSSLSLFCWYTFVLLSKMIKISSIFVLFYFQQRSLFFGSDQETRFFIGLEDIDNWINRIILTERENPCLVSCSLIDWVSVTAVGVDINDIVDFCVWMTVTMAPNPENSEDERIFDGAS